jgi:hypothetical protein
MLVVLVTILLRLLLVLVVWALLLFMVVLAFNLLITAEGLGRVLMVRQILGQEEEERLAVALRMLVVMVELES